MHIVEDMSRLKIYNLEGKDVLLDPIGSFSISIVMDPQIIELIGGSNNY